MSARRFSWLLLPALLAACDTERPTALGRELLPGESVRSFAVTLDAAQFLVRDTSFALYGGMEDADFLILARAHGGVLDAHAFARFVMPTGIGVVDTAGVARTDTMPVYVRGEILLVADSLATSAPELLRVAAHRFAEAWDPAVADWTLRRAGESWSVPGGTPGAEIAEVVYVRGDTLRLEVDSATLALWADTSNAERGALLRVLDAPSRLRTSRPRLRLFARSSYKPDTLFSVMAQASDAGFVYHPSPDTLAGDIRFNGLPEWRAFLQLRPDLRGAVVSCGPGCSVALTDADITRAELLLQPRTPPPGFDPELAIAPVAYSALFAPLIPLPRTPLGSAVGSTASPLAPAVFRDDAEPVALDITQFVRQVVMDTTTDGSTGRTEWLALLAGNTRTLGFGRFAPQPRLRLVLTTAKEIRLP